MTLRTLIVDDEPVARRRLRRLLRHDPEVQVIGECGDGAAAVNAIRTQAPDLVLLDVEMPELDGFSALRSIDPARIPVVIFVTAFDRYALRAFDVHALDYLLKPVDWDRLALSLARARTRIAERRASAGTPVDDRLIALLTELASGRRYLTRLHVRSHGRLLVLDLADVDWIGASDNYVELHAGGQRHLVRDTMGRLERELDPDCFVRIHRSSIVRIDRIKELLPDFHGDFTLVLKNGSRLTLSRTYRTKVEAALGRAL
jgi:two-component system LytT family response regulator